MSNIKKTALGIVSKVALANARKEVNSACVLFCCLGKSRDNWMTRYKVG